MTTRIFGIIAALGVLACTVVCTVAWFFRGHQFSSLLAACLCAMTTGFVAVSAARS